MNSRSRLLILLACSGMSLVFSGCLRDSMTRTYQIRRPIYSVKANVLAAINGDPQTSLASIGDIYLKDQYVYVNEIDKGIHVLDNSDPTSPKQVAFLAIPGNEDLVIHGNTLYADMYGDLLGIDITDPTHVKVLSVTEALFPDRMYLNGYGMDSNTVITGWIVKDTTMVQNQSGCNACYPTIYYGAGGPLPAMNLASAASTSVNGVSGSEARFVLINDYLCAITERHSLGILDVSSNSPKILYNTFSGYDLETIYPFKDKVFLGSAEGTFIYDVSNPASPTEVCSWTHGTACDPVITDGQYAYVTLKSGTNCGGASNELDVLDVSQLPDIYQVGSYPMTGPGGLSKSGNLLFVCDAASGVRVFDASQPRDLKQINSIDTRNPYDLIATNNDLILVGADGLYQYNYANPKQISPLSLFNIH
jgi:hypothetical protein